MSGDDAANGPDERGPAGARERSARGRPTWPAVGGLLAVLWLFVRGVELAPVSVVGELVLGLALGLPLAYVSRRFYWPETDVPRFLRASPYMALYAAAFLKELVVANVDVAYRVLAPWMPIEPAVIDLPLRVRTDVAITTIANSITLTPGTLSMDYDEERNSLYVHAIDGRDPEAVVAPIRRWEDYALVIFDEELKPSDPVPQTAAREDRTPAAEDGADTEGAATEGGADTEGGESGGG